MVSCFSKITLPRPGAVAALYDRTAAHAVVLRNLLQRQGYQSLDELLAEGQWKDGPKARLKRCWPCWKGVGLR
jgi:hypothetical protein